MARFSLPNLVPETSGLGEVCKCYECQAMVETCKRTMWLTITMHSRDMGLKTPSLIFLILEV